MFQVEGNPRIETTVTLIGQGREQKLPIVFRHKTQDEYTELLQQMRDDKISVEQVLVAVIESWEASVPLGEKGEGIATLRQHQPGADYALLAAYNESLAVGRAKN